METGGKQSRLLARLIGRLRGEHHRPATLDNQYSYNKNVMSESTGCGSSMNIDAENDVEAQTQGAETSSWTQGPSNADLRYSGQYLTPEQLPEFCDQIHNLVEVIRNIQSYAIVTGEYPAELECRLEEEALSVCALEAEVRNARDVVARTRAQRRALRAHRTTVTAQLAELRESEIRELESAVRLSDRKLFKNWEAIKESTDPAVFEPLIEEIKNKQTALECLVRLIKYRRNMLLRSSTLPRPLPPPDANADDSSKSRARSARRGRRRRSCRSPRSVPLSGEASHHDQDNSVIIFGTSLADHASMHLTL